jgi:hypothetical protein
VGAFLNLVGIISGALSAHYERVVASDRTRASRRDALSGAAGPAV